MKEQYCLPDFLKKKEEYDEKKLKEIKEKKFGMAFKVVRQAKIKQCLRFFCIFLFFACF
jgi:hypothetical protein